MQAGPGDRPEQPLTLVIDRRPLVLAALSRILASPPLNAQVVSATRSSEAVEIVARRAIDLVVCDVKSEPIPGTELPVLLAERRPTVRVVLLADPEDESLLIASLQSGAAGFFTKDCALEEFLEGMDAVLRGNYVLGKNLVQQALAKLASGAEHDARQGVDRLSLAERNVLALIGQAQSIRSIAAARGTSTKTVRNHLASIYQKLDLHNRTEAVLWAARMDANRPAAELGTGT